MLLLLTDYKWNIVMKAFKNLIEFIAKDNKHFYNRDIKCPVCGETMWFDDSKIDLNITEHRTLQLVCRNECCTMDIEYKRHILWDDKL